MAQSVPNSQGGKKEPNSMKLLDNNKMKPVKTKNWLHQLNAIIRFCAQE